MESILVLLIEKFEVFLLVLVRCSAIFLMTPIFGRRNVPAVFKVGLALMLSIVLLPAVELSSGFEMGFLQLALLAAKEAAVGLIIGFVTYVVFTAIYFAGQIIDMKTGFGIVNVLDPQTNTQIPIMGNFLYIFTLIVFITMDGHLMLIKALAESFTIVPAGHHLQVTAETVAELVSTLHSTFVIGFKISAPVVAAVFLTDVALGILARTMPQMNVFMVGMPLKIMIGMFTLMIMIPVFAIVLDVLFTNTAQSIYRILIKL
jgi:flagellar biosynthetic protein FliR